MITEPIRRLIESLPCVFVVTADPSGHPHMAISGQVVITENSRLIFENCFCPSTLQNISDHCHVSVVAVAPETGKGYQMLGSVAKRNIADILYGNGPDIHLPETSSVLTRFTVKVEKILEFTSGIHSDIPIVY